MSRNDRDVVIAMLRQIKEDLQKHYYDPALHGMDIERHFADAEREIKAATDFNQAMALLVDPVWKLDDSHTTFFPPNRALQVDYGWDMGMVGDLALVLRVDRSSDAAAQGLSPGDRVLTLNRFQPDRSNLWQIEYFYRFIRPQAQQHLVVRRPDGTERTLDVKSHVTKKPLTELADLIDELYSRSRSTRHRQAIVGNDTAVWKMPAFDSPDAVRDEIKRARKSKTMILDLRGNGGGRMVALQELVRQCFDHEVLLAVERRRTAETQDRVKPAKDAFAGSLIVLVDSRSASAAEIFARVVQIEKRGTVLGDRTAGAVMESQFFSHSVGVSAVAFYATSVTVADLRMSDGNSLEKIGVVPDQLAVPTPPDLAAGRDPVLARALEIAGHPTTPEQAAALFPGKR
jgi:carboxyl-terminal processing protease